MSATDKPGGRVLDPVLLNMLVCPQSLGVLEYDRANQELVCKQSGLAYPIRDGVPILLIPEARRIDGGLDAAGGGDVDAAGGGDSDDG